MRMFEGLCKVFVWVKNFFSWTRSGTSSTNIITGDNNKVVNMTYINGNSERVAQEQPDLAMRFVYPKSPALILVNQSTVIARDIKWTVVLWNMDFPERNDPLPIPVSTYDWLKPHDESGPQNLFISPLVEPLLKSGNRLFGSASVCSPESVRGRTYIVYIVWGEGGWYSEVEEEMSGKIDIPQNFLKSTREEYFKTLEAKVPYLSRVAISER